MSEQNGKARGRLSATEKLKILKEARAANRTVAEVLRQQQLDATTFYRWEREAKAAALEALGDKPRVRNAMAHENELLKAESAKKGRISAQVVEANLALKGGDSVQRAARDTLADRRPIARLEHALIARGEACVRAPRRLLDVYRVYCHNPWRARLAGFERYQASFQVRSAPRT